MKKYIVTDKETARKIEVLAYTPAIAWSVAVYELKTTNIELTQTTL